MRVLCDSVIGREVEAGGELGFITETSELQWEGIPTIDPCWGGL